MKEFVKNTAYELILGTFIVLATVMICAIFWKNDYKPEYELEKYKNEQAQKAIDSLQKDKIEYLKAAAKYVNSADSALAIWNAAKKDRVNQTKLYETISTSIDNFSERELDSFLAIH